MDWAAVVKNLEEQTAFYTKRANECASEWGKVHEIDHYQRSVDIASIMASAFRAGLEVPPA